ncbi:MAG: twin-arginine translocase subunit TatB [Pseudomonadota bacterium]|nr:MAG: twin-arginine translocase subunit TatB [Pseudomonadota bacterium]
MFDIAFSELVVIGLVALLILGPKRLPEMARTAGRWMAGLRRFIDNVKQEVDREVRSEDLQAFRKLQDELNDTRELLRKSGADTLDSLSKLQVNPEPAATAASASEPAPSALTAPVKKKTRSRAKTATKKHGERKAKR